MTDWRNLFGAPGYRRWKINIAVALVLALAPILPALSSPPPALPYDDRLFEQAQSAGRTVVVDTYAAWCLPCRIQAPILARLKQDERFAEILVMRVGEDSPKSVWRKFSLPGYGMMVVYRRGREIARGMPTSEATMRILLSAAH